MNTATMYFDKAKGHLIAEASTQGVRIPGETVMVTSHHTGIEVEFKMVDAEQDRDGDIVSWLYVPVDPVAVSLLVVLND